MLLLTQQDVTQLLDVDVLLERLEHAFVELSAGRASVPSRVAAVTPRGLLAAMPGYVDGVLAAKLVALFPDHDPSHQALIAVFDAATGTPQAVMDGTHITAVRTGASSAVATSALAREDARAGGAARACKAARTSTGSGASASSPKCAWRTAPSSTRRRWRRKRTPWPSSRSRKRREAPTSSAAARTPRRRS